MITDSINNHRANALKAFREGMIIAEEKLTKNQSSDRVKVLMDLAELHLLANETGKAETELKEALHHFIDNKCEDSRSIIYIVHILKSLSGLHACQGRKHEAKSEEADALIWEERLNKLNKHH